MLQMRFYILHLVKKRPAFTVAQTTAGKELRTFYSLVHPTHPHVCPDTSHGADTAGKWGGGLQEEASRFPRTETTKLTQHSAVTGISHLTGVLSSNLARNIPGCDSVLAQPTVFRGGTPSV